MKHVVASDTDSAYFTLTKIIKKIYPDSDSWDKKERIKVLLKLTDKIQENANENLNTITKDLFNMQSKHYFELKQEVIAEKAYWAGKRRYAMYIVNKEGVEIEELEMKGLDLMKSNFPALFRNFGEEILKDILFSKPKPEIDTKIMDFKSSLQDRPWKQLMKPSGVKKISDYIEFPPVEGEIFSTLKKRCPINTRGAIAYNDLLRYYKLNVKYPEFRIGDKMYLAYLNSNPYNLSVIGLNGYDDPPFVLEFIEKYIDKEGIFNSVFKNKIENLYNDLRWDLNMNPYREEFFDFG
jgi:hypothetical protein